MINIKSKIEYIKSTLRNALADRNIGYTRHNYHKTPDDLLHVSMLAIKPYTCIIQHKSASRGTQFYIVISGGLSIIKSRERNDELSESTGEIDATTGPIDIDRSDWRRLTNNRNCIVYYFEINTGPHIPSDTFWQ